MALDDPITVAGNFLAVVGFPAYIGFADGNLGIFALYVLVAGLLLTFFDRFNRPDSTKDRSEALGQAAILRVGAFGLASVPCYFLAVLAI